jgi:hypothetical protein
MFNILFDRLSIEIVMKCKNIFLLMFKLDFISAVLLKHLSFGILSRGAKSRFFSPINSRCNSHQRHLCLFCIICSRIKCPLASARFTFRGITLRWLHKNNLPINDILVWGFTFRWLVRRKEMRVRVKMRVEVKLSPSSSSLPSHLQGFYVWKNIDNTIVFCRV